MQGLQQGNSMPQHATTLGWIHKVLHECCSWAWAQGLPYHSDSEAASLLRCLLVAVLDPLARLLAQYGCKGVHVLLQAGEGEGHQARQGRRSCLAAGVPHTAVQDVSLQPKEVPHGAGPGDKGRGWDKWGRVGGGGGTVGQGRLCRWRHAGLAEDPGRRHKHACSAAAATALQQHCNSLHMHVHWCGKHSCSCAGAAHCLHTALQSGLAAMNTLHIQVGAAACRESAGTCAAKGGTAYARAEQEQLLHGQLLWTCHTAALWLTAGPLMKTALAAMYLSALPAWGGRVPAFRCASGLPPPLPGPRPPLRPRPRPGGGGGSIICMR